MKKIIITLLAASAMLSASAAATRVDTLRAKFLNPTDSEVLVAVHRGDWRNYTENSLEGIESAVRMGADIVEVDLRRTADGELILMHDPKVDRTTTGKGKVSDLTLGQIRELRLRNGVMGRTPYKVPTLEELLLAQKGRVLINLDKAFDYFDQVMEILDRTGTTSQIIMKSEAPASEVKERYGKYLDRVIYMPIVRMDKPGAVGKVQDFLEQLNPPAMELTYADSCSTVPPVIGRMCQGRTRVWVNSLWSSLAGGHDDFASLVDPEAGFGFLVDSIGATVIQTDQPKYLMEWLGDRGRKPWRPDAATMKRYKRVAAADRCKNDWAKFGRYAEANAALAEAPKVVFMGNSITDTWARRRPDFFSSRGMAGRGISGQTTSHMLARFRADVVNLKPRAVVILAGINDIALNNGRISLENIAGNIASMCDVARAAGIKPVICSLLPSKHIRWRPWLTPAADVAALNAMLREYAAANKIDFVDYYTAMADDEGGLDARYTEDGVHPTDAGYEVMESIVLPHLAKYLKK